MSAAAGMLLRNARVWERGTLRLADVALERERVAEVTEPGAAAARSREADLDGRVLLPGLVNAHDHLDFSTFPALGTPPYASVYEWAAAVDGGADDPAAAAALAVSLPDRLFLGGVRNLLAGATAVAHHNPFHRSLARPDFPVRVLERYQFAHSPGLTPELRRTYRSSDRRIPWMIHAGEGTDARCRGELRALAGQRLLRHNTVIIHAIGAEREDLPLMAAAQACVVWCPESNRRLYGSTAPVAELRAAGVRVGLGSDSPVSGVRDPLSNLAAARGENVLADAELIELATRTSAEVARLPCGAFAPGAAADLLAVDSLEGLLSGRREAVALVVVGGRARYGDTELMRPLDARALPVRVEGRQRLLEAGMARRAGAIRRQAGGRAGAAWLGALEL